MTPNGWKPIPMEYDAATGFWKLTLDVLPDTYRYGFETFKEGDDLTATGSWALDPLNTVDNDSKVVVTESSERTSPKIEGKTVTFSYKAKTAEKVFIAGGMNGWDTSMSEESEYKLTWNELTECWEVTREISAGSYEYKIIADFGLGMMWLRDPLNPNKTDTNDPNSILIIAGLANSKVTMNRGIGKVELPAKLNLFDEAGVASEVAVTYALSDETKNAAYKDAVKVTEEQGKAYVNITEAFPEDVTEFTLTAADANENTSKITVNIVDKTYKYTIYYYDKYPSHMSEDATDLWIWENGGSAGNVAYTFEGKETLNESDVWLKATVEVPYTNLGIIARSYDGWYWQDEDRTYSNTEEKEEVTLYYVFGQDISTTYPTELPAPVKEPDPRYLVVEYTRPAGTDGWYFYTWNNGRYDPKYIEEKDENGNPFIPFKDEDGDGTGIAVVPIGAGNESVSFCLERKADGAHWAEKDGGDYLCALPLDQTVVKVKMVEGQGITYVYPYNSGYEIDVPESKIHFYYRDDEAFLKGCDSGHASAQLEIRVKGENGTTGAAETKNMTYDQDDSDGDPEQQRYEYDVDELQMATYYYRYVLKDDEGNTTYALDKFNEEKETIDGVDYSVCKYEIFDIELQASMKNGSMDYNDNNVLTLTVKAKDSAPSQQTDQAQPEENKLPAGFEVSKALVDLSAIGGNSEAEIDPELLQLSVAVKSSIETGTKTLPITLYDQYNNLYTTEASVNVVPRNNSSHVADDFDWDEAVVYFAVTDRFFDGNAGNNEGGVSGSYDKTTNNGLNSSYHGGDFAGLTQKLDYLQDLGVNTIWITPIVENQTIANDCTDQDKFNLGVTKAWGYTGYWAKDFTKIDAHLGTEVEFSALLDAAHAKGMKVMVDVVLNHTGYGDEITNYFDTNFKNEDGETIRMLRSEDEVVAGNDQKSSLSGLPDFRTEDPEVRELIVEWQSNWISKYPIDYYRVDTVKHVDNTTWSAFKNALTEINPDFKMIGEWAGAGYATDTGMLNAGRMDALLDFDFPAQAANFVTGDLSGVEGFLSARNGAIDNTASLGAFLSNHDQMGFVHRLKTEKGKSEDEAKQLALVAASLQLTAKGQVYIYYGEEIGESDGEENYPYQTNRKDFEWDKVTDDNQALAHYKKLLSIRNEYLDVLAKGSRGTLVADNQRGLDVFTRSYGGTSLIVALNIKDEQQYVLAGQAPGAAFYDHYSGKQYVADANGNVVIDIPSVADGGTVVLGAGSGGQINDNVPGGMQIKSIPDQTYTGLSIKLPEDVLQVYDGTTRLTAGVDYTVSYKNNKAVGTATVTIKGKGNYKGSETAQFNIVPKNVSELNIVYKDILLANGKTQKPLSKIMNGNKKLAAKEYQVEYYKLDANGTRTSGVLKGVKEAGEYEMVITCLKNYTGTVTKAISVKDTGKYMSSLRITLEYTSKVYTGSALEPTVTVKNGETVLKGAKAGAETADTEYTVSYSNNTNVGTANVIITGVSAKGYYGSATKTFKITGTELSKVAQVDTDTAKWQAKLDIDPIKGNAEQPNAVLKPKSGQDITLTKGTDYTVSYTNNTKPGTATAVFTGAGKYTGTIKKTFKINAIKWTQDDSNLVITVDATAPYSKKGATAGVTVTYKNKRLAEGKDYKLTYTNNKKIEVATAAKAPSVAVTGIGSFSGKVNGGKFSIVAADLSDAKNGITVTVPDAVYIDSDGNFAVKPVVKCADGTYLTSGTDYTVEYKAYVGSAWVEKTSSDAALDKGTPMMAIVTGNGNYAGKVEKEYKIVSRSIRKATIIAKAQSYTGKAITLDADDFSKAKVGRDKLVYGVDYEIVPGSYQKNVNKGTASVTVRGIGNYGDEKRVTFRITSSVMRWWWNLFS